MATHSEFGKLRAGCCGGAGGEAKGVMAKTIMRGGGGEEIDYFLLIH